MSLLDDNKISEQPKCNLCIHKENGLKCKAFDVIPDEILFNKVTHNKVMVGQKGDFVYTKIKE